MSKISVYIIAFNEAKKVAATIESVRWADEIVLVDSNSTDGTQEIAARMGVKIVQVEFKGFGDLLRCLLLNKIPYRESMMSFLKRPK